MSEKHFVIEILDYEDFLSINLNEMCNFFTDEYKKKFQYDVQQDLYYF